MSDPLLPEPILYNVAYSERVRGELRRLAVAAKGRGLKAEFLAALKEIDRRLHIYPQFGQPLRDLKLEPAQVWIGAVPPLVVQYILDEERHLVMVVVPILRYPTQGSIRSCLRKSRFFQKPGGLCGVHGGSPQKEVIAR
jgi:hypothetical protein